MVVYKVAWVKQNIPVESSVWWYYFFEKATAVRAVRMVNDLTLDFYYTSKQGSRSLSRHRALE